MNKTNIKFNTVAARPSKYWLALLVLIAAGIGYAGSSEAASSEAASSEAASPETTRHKAAGSEQANTAAYIDSVQHWGPWELDIEPAAGGLQPPKTRPVLARETRLKLRTNSFSAIAPAAPPAPVIVVTNTPVPAPVPAAPPAPPVTPPIGGPADGLF